MQLDFVVLGMDIAEATSHTVEMGAKVVLAHPARQPPPAPQSQCLPTQKYLCGVSHPYTTAQVFQSNNSSASSYACQSYCQDGCCYLFNPHLKVNLYMYKAIIGWVLLGLSLICAIILCIFSVINANNANETCLRDFQTAVAIANAPVNLHPNFNPNHVPDRNNQSIPNITHINKINLIGCIFITYTTIGVSFVTSMLILELSDQQNVQNSLYWTFYPHTAAIIALTATCVLFLLVSMYVVSICCKHSETNRLREKIHNVMGKLKNANNAASALVALIAICLLPLIGGWDGISGLAFSDKDPSVQSFEQNTVRYTHITSQQTALAGIVISFLTKTLIGMIFQLFHGSS